MSYTTAQIAEALGVKTQVIDYRVKKEGWPFQKRKGKGGGRLFIMKDLPKPVRDAVLAWELKTSPPATVEKIQSLAIIEKAQPPAINGYVDTSLLNRKQREVMCARLAFVREIERLAATGLAKVVIRNNLVEASRRGELPPHLAPLAVMANDRSGGNRSLSSCSLQRWCLAFANGGEAALAPARPGPDLTVPEWAEAFLAAYRRPQKPSVVDAYEDVFGPRHRPIKGSPSIHAVRRFLKKLSLPAREYGRLTGNAWRSIMPYKRKSTEGMMPGDIFTFDGTTVDQEVLHPNGYPFKPEETYVIDVVTRRCVGMSFALAESAESVLDALRVACLFGGIPAEIYTDNGPGYKNSLMTAVGLGMMDRLGITMFNSRPGAPQGKGLMERAVKTAGKLCKQFLSCTHGDMDRDAAKKIFKLSRRSLKNGTNILPRFEDYARARWAERDRYNDTPHRALPLTIDPETGKKRHFTPNEYWQSFRAQGWEPVLVPEAIRDELFMPGTGRKVNRGYVSLYTKSYFSKELEELHGEMVEVRYDMEDPSTVYIWSMEGVKICQAALEGNTIQYREKSLREIAGEKRRKAQLKRLEVKAQRIEPGATLSLPESIPYQYSDTLITGGVKQSQIIDVEAIPAPSNTRPLFLNRMHHYRWLMEHRDQCTETDESWLAEYAQDPEYLDMADRYAFEKIAYAGPVAQAKEASR